MPAYLWLQNKNDKGKCQYQYKKRLKRYIFMYVYGPNIFHIQSSIMEIDINYNFYFHRPFFLGFACFQKSHMFVKKKVYACKYILLLLLLLFF